MTNEFITLGHGSGGRVMHSLINDFFKPLLKDIHQGDSAILNFYKPSNIAFTTDSYVVSPLFFPGGNIGDLAVNGTVNDLAVSGAKPLFMTVGFIIEEGFLLSDLQNIVKAMADSALKAGIKIVSADTKVVQKGKCDGIFINTSAIGIIPEGLRLTSANVKDKDRIIISGSIASHGIAVMGQRNGLIFDPPVYSDTVALNRAILALIEANCKIKIMRDPTRGGLATTLKELAVESQSRFEIEEDLIPIKSAVKGACDLLGLDPLHVANEGIFVAIIAEHDCEKAIQILRQFPESNDACIIGLVNNHTSYKKGSVILKTSIGGMRLVDMLAGQQLPRIC